MARNEHDGRSLEERLASLDAMSDDGGRSAPEGERPPEAQSPSQGPPPGPPQVPQQAPAEQENAPPPLPLPPPPVPGEPVPGESGPPSPQGDPGGNPWLSAPPAFQQAPEGYPPENFGPPQPPPYDGGPMPQPFDGGMLPPPYPGAGGFQGHDPAQVPQPPQPPQPPYPPQQSPYDANGNTAPPLDQLPPYAADQFPSRDAEAAAPPYQQDPEATSYQQFPPIDPNAGPPQFPPMDPNAGQPPFQPGDPNTGQPQFSPGDPNAGQPQFPPMDPSAGQPPFSPGDPNAGQPQFPQGDPSAAGQAYQPQDPNAGMQPYPFADPNTGQPYPPVDPNTGQLYQHHPNSTAAQQQQFPPMLDPAAGPPYQQDPNAAPQQQYATPIDPNTGQPYQQDPNAAPQQQYGPPIDPSTGQPYQQVDPNTGQPYQPVDPNTGQPAQGYGYPQQQGYPGQAPQQPPMDPQNADSLSSENLLGERRIAPSSGWRRAVYKATAGNIHPGESQGDLRRKDLIARARTAVAGGHHRVAVMSLKGGVGKTTTTTGLGSMLGSLRGDTVIAVDANPDRGTLSDKVKLETAATVRDLLNNRDQIHRYADVRAFTSQNNARLEVLASDRDPAVSEAFSAEDYAAVAVVLEQYYSICITDCGTGLLHSAMAGVLSLADQLVLVSSPSVDGARSASATLDWLEAHDHGHLVRNGVVVLSMVRNRTRSQVDLDKLQAHFESRCRAVVRIPYDDHLEEGAEVDLEQLALATREAYLNLAAVVGDGFAYQRPTSS
ncbi:AAA family ATPase [Actinomadura syzygii]